MTTNAERLENALTAIADAIRIKRNISTELTLEEMPDEILAIVSNIRIISMSIEQQEELSDNQSANISILQVPVQNVSIEQTYNLPMPEVTLTVV